MIDIIIPAYNAHNTITKTLSSIAYQEQSNLLNVYIINDCSDKDYKEIINHFKSMINIKELKLKKNSGPGVARQYGIDHSNGDYIIFIDADDVFYDCYSIKNLYKNIQSNNYDVVMSIAIEERNNNYIKQIHNNGNLHGKIYRRKFLTDNEIKFNNTYTSEDNSFNQLILLLDSKIKNIYEITYVYKDNSKSITRKKINSQLILNDYIENMIWAVNESKKIKENKIKIACLLYSSYLYIYYITLANFSDNIEKIKKLETLFQQYENQLNIYIKQNIEKEKIQIIIQQTNLYTLPNISFDEYRKQIQKNIK